LGEVDSAVALLAVVLEEIGEFCEELWLSLAAHFLSRQSNMYLVIGHVIRSHCEVLQYYDVLSMRGVVWSMRGARE
jgi:hypothetical protein